MTDWNSDDIPPNRTSGRRAASPPPRPRESAPSDGYVLSPGQSASKCSGPHCGATIYWIRANGRWVPVDCLAPGSSYPSVVKAVQRQLDMFGAQPEEPREGFGHAHLDRCPDAAYLRERAAQRRQQR